MAKYLNPDLATLPVNHYVCVTLPSGTELVATADEDPQLLKIMRRILANNEQLRADYAAAGRMFEDV